MDEREFLTVGEVMAHLRMGRTFVYQEARRHLATGGTAGIPCRKFGRLLRFPTSELYAYAALRPSTSTTQRATSVADRVTRTTRRRARRTDQTSLFDARNRQIDITERLDRVASRTPERGVDHGIDIGM